MDERKTLLVMVSVCMATFNGEMFLHEQIDSILQQLDSDDELIISDDGSTDATIDIIKSYNDRRIKLTKNTNKHGFVSNFENALNHSSGDIIFLSDQDDVWFENKVSSMKQFLVSNNVEVAMNNCTVTDERLIVLQEKLFSKKRNPKCYGVVGNLIINQWLGCCMVIKRKALIKCLPFPEGVIAHDIWIGLIANSKMRVGYNDTSLQFYRRHNTTTSTATGKSKRSYRNRIKYRLQLIKTLFLNL